MLSMVRCASSRFPYTYYHLPCSIAVDYPGYNAFESSEGQATIARPYREYVPFLYLDVLLSLDFRYNRSYP